MAEWVEVRTPGARWTVAAVWADRLLSPQGLRVDAWRAEGRFHLLKHAPHRTLARIDLPPVSLYYKHYPVPDLRSQVRTFLRPAKARGEFEKAIELARRGVPTVEPLAWGETDHGESFLLTLGLQEVEPLQAFIEQTFPSLPGSVRAAVRQALAVELGRFLARLHQAGVLHHDLHAGNILLRLAAGNRPELFLIDLHTVRLGPPLDWRASRDNLIILNRWFVQRASRSDRRRFWRAYVRTRWGGAWERQAERRAAVRLEERTWDSCLAFWRGRDRRWLVDGRYCQVVARDGVQAWAVRDLPADALHDWLADPDRPLGDDGSRVLKHSRSSTVAALAAGAGGAKPSVIYKRFMPTKAADAWLQTLRPTPALRSWLNGHRLRECGVPTPRPLAVLHRRRGGLTHESYLVTELLPGAVELHRHGADPAVAGDVSSRRELIDRVARLVRELHRRGLTHRDLKAANILVSPAGLHLIDLVGVERWRRVPRARRVQNLARLHASFHDRPWLSRTDKLRFLRTYLAWGLHGRGGWKEWWREVAAATAAKVARNARRGRPLA